MYSPASGRGQIAHHLLDHPEQRLDLHTMAARQVVSREHPQGDDWNSNLVTPPHEFLELVRAGLIAGNQRLARSVGARPPTISIGQYGDVARQPIGVQLGDEPMLIGGIKQSRRVKPIDELAPAVETCHNWQRIPPRSAIRPCSNGWSWRRGPLR